MQTLNLTNQTAIRNQVQPYMVALWQELLKRKEVWELITPEKRQVVIDGEHDVMIDLAWDIFKKLYKNFFGDKFLPLRDMME